MKLFSFHFAGGNEYSFKRILKDNSIGIEVERDNCFSLSEYVVSATDKLISNLNVKQQYVLYGHSMGALVSYLICHRLQEMDYRMPEKLIISGYKPPFVARDKKIAHLPDHEFWKKILSFGGTPDDLSDYPELVEYILPILRYDFSLIESYKYEEKGKLNIPIDVFYGSEEAEEAEMSGWNEVATKEVNIKKMKGNHFFIFDHVTYFQHYFNKLINKKCYELY